MGSRDLIKCTSSSVVLVVEVAADDSNPWPLIDFFIRPLDKPLANAEPFDEGDISMDVATPLVDDLATPPFDVDFGTPQFDVGMTTSDDEE